MKMDDQLDNSIYNLSQQYNQYKGITLPEGFDGKYVKKVLL